MHTPRVNLAYKMFFLMIGLNNIVLLKCDEPTLTSTQTNDLKMNSSFKSTKVACETHTNCSSRILTLDTYCCPTKNYCCNWFEFATTYRFESKLPLKSPSILTILAILLLIICVLFVGYCFSILFCFCFKCGIFKRPKVVILSQSHNTESSLFGHSNNSPKHSTSTSSSNSSYTSNRRAHRHVPAHKNYKKKSQNKQHRHLRSPTARVYSNKRPQYNDADIYLDFDSNLTNDSPFLIPPELNEQVQERVNRSLNNQNPDSSKNRRNTSIVRNNTMTSTSTQPSAPLATDDSNFEENHRPANILEPVIGSSLSASTSSSIGLGASSADNYVANNADQVTHSSSATHTTTVRNYYNDEQPPSYDDIIRRNY